MRVLLTSLHSWPAVTRGAERYAHELAQALRDGGHRVTLASTGRPAREVVAGHEVRRVREAPAGWPAARRERWWGARLVPLAARADVWHATATGDAWAATRLAPARRTLRTVVTDHGFPVRDSRARQGVAELHDHVVRRVDRYVCVSRAAAAHLLSDHGRAADVVPPGVDTRLFTPGGPRAPRPTVLYSGDVAESRKGVRDLVAATALLPGVTLWLAGPGRADLAGLPTGHVEVLGAVPPGAMPDLYRRAWLTALPSVAESFGMALLESLACGTPGVARRDGGGPAELLTAGTGELVDPSGDLVAALAAAVGTALEERDDEACRERATQFDWRTAVVPALLELYA